MASIPTGKPGGKLYVWTPRRRQPSSSYDMNGLGLSILLQHRVIQGCVEEIRQSVRRHGMTLHRQPCPPPTRLNNISRRWNALFLMLKKDSGEAWPSSKRRSIT